MSSCKYADVIVDIVHEKLDKAFTYRIPTELLGSVCVGSAVNIPFGMNNKLKKGYVIEINDELKPGLDPDILKDIDSLAKKVAGVENEFIDLAAWMKDRYGCTMIQALKTVLPVKQKAGTRAKDPYSISRGKHQYTLHEPNVYQQSAIDRFKADYDKGESNTYLLFGITGSGKTDAYLHIMRYVVEQGRQVILLIPEISLTYQTIDRLYATFGDRICVLHSKLTPGERWEQIQRCSDGTADIIIGPRSAVFAPFKNIGLIVIDEEHDGAYKNENIPRYNTIDVAIKRAKTHNAALVLASATPSPDSYKRALTGEYKLLRLPERTAGALIPDIEVVDMRDELKKGNRSIFSERLNELILDRLSKKEQIILFMNRRGYSNFVSCRSCGNAIRCPHCDISLTQHVGYRLVCHYCGYEIPQPKSCPTCGSPYIAEFGTGTQKLEKMVAKMYPQARVARMDTDSAVKKKASEEILNRFAKGDIDILIGTQMVVKGHDYPNVTLVGIMAADTSLYVSNYDSGERTYELISQAAGRAGRGSKKGSVVVQTYKPEHYAIQGAVNSDYEEYYKYEIGFRDILGYPPAMHIWTAQISSKDEELMLKVADDYSKICEKVAKANNAQFIGPIKPSVYKVNDYFRILTYFKHQSYDILIKSKTEVEKEFFMMYPDLMISILHDFT